MGTGKKIWGSSVIESERTLQRDSTCRSQPGQHSLEIVRHARLRIITRSLAVLVLLAGPAGAQETLRLDLPRLVEIDAMDGQESRVKRFAITARGALGQEIKIPDSQNFFCTLSHAYNMVLNYYPENDERIFWVQSNPGAQFAAGGLATCLDLSVFSDRPGSRQ